MVHGPIEIVIISLPAGIAVGVFAAFRLSRLVHEVNACYSGEKT